MNNKTMSIIAVVVAVVIIAAAAVAVVNNTSKNKSSDTVDVNAGKIAESFIQNYDGDYDQDFSLVITDANNAKASAAVSGGQISEVYVSYSITDKAKDLFDASKATSEAKIKAGSKMSGLTYTAITEKGSFSDGYGYYGDCVMPYQGSTMKFVSIHYSALYKNVYAESVLYIYGSNYADHNFTEVVTAMYNAIQKPVDATLEQKVQAFANSCPEALKAEFTVSVDGNTAKAVAAGTGMMSTIGLTITKCDSESKAKEYFDVQKDTYESKLGPSMMSGLTYYEIQKTGTSTNSYGYYGDCSTTISGTAYTFVTIHFTGYQGDTTFDASFYVDGKLFNDIKTDFTSVVAVIDACMTL